MNQPASTSLLDDILRKIPRRYRLPASSDALARPLDEWSPAALCLSRAHGKMNAAGTLALTIERVRRIISSGDTPAPALKQAFIESLARMIREALHPDAGDPVFQSMTLGHLSAAVREYTSLITEYASQDRRRVHAAVNAMAHPAKLQQLPPGEQRNTLSRVHAAMAAADWPALRDATEHLLAANGIHTESRLGAELAQLLNNPALERLLRLAALEKDEEVKRYRSLREQQNPQPRSRKALEQGAASRQRGAAVETLTAQALEALAQRLNQAEADGTRYRVVTSMRVPASIPASPERAKSEWDAVLLRQTAAADCATVWDVCLLVEAKASADAAVTDFPKLLRGLKLLSQADENTNYSFQTRQGPVSLRGASLNALAAGESSLSRTILYCSDAPAETAPRLLNPASRMQLLSARASLEFAASLAENPHADARVLEPVWHDLLESPRCRAVLHQYSTLRQVRELMVHTADMLATVA